MFRQREREREREHTMRYDRRREFNVDWTEQLVA